MLRMHLWIQLHRVLEVDYMYLGFVRNAAMDGKLRFIIELMGKAALAVPIELLFRR
jgi:hypothetical protein